MHQNTAFRDQNLKYFLVRGILHTISLLSVERETNRTKKGVWTKMGSLTRDSLPAASPVLIDTY